MKKNLTVIFFVFLLAACATTNQPGIARYTPAPKNRTYSSQYPFAQNGNIILKRDGGFMGAAIDATIFINREKVVQLSPGEYYRLHLPNGVYFISLESGKVVNLGKPFERTIKLEINDNSHVTTIRIFPMPTQGMTMEEVYE